MKTERLLTVAAALLVCFALNASDVRFSGGNSRVSLQENNKIVTLSDPGIVNTEDFDIRSDSIQLYGEDYRYVKCDGNVEVLKKDDNLTLKCTSLTYDRQLSVLVSDGWASIDDPEHEAQLSGARVEYDSNLGLMKVQMGASIKKETSDGLLSCSADSIEFDSQAMTLNLKGKAHVVWDDDVYGANVIMIDIDNKQIALYQSITGEIHG